MDTNHTCPVCQKKFTYLGNMKKHLNMIHSIDHGEQKQFICPVCSKSFTRKHDMKRHIETIHVVITESQPNNQVVSMLITKISELQTKLEENNDKLVIELKEQFTQELQKKTSLINNIVNNLNIVCVSDHDNYLDMLADRMGDMVQAIEYIKDCALSNIIGDCKLIEKIYNNGKGQLGFTTDGRKSTIYFHDENEKECQEPKESFGRKIANNLQNSYLKGINYLIQENLDHKGDPNKFLGSYDLMAWNQHVYQLSDVFHQKKIVSQLKIPIVKV